MTPIHTILHPTDFSESSEYAFHAACALARDYGARVIILHAVGLPTFAYAEGVIPPDIVELREASKEQLHRLVPDSNVPVDYRLEEGDPATVIQQVAQEVNADLIVMGTHGRKGLVRLLLGSVAEQTVRQAPCPVLTVRQPFAEVLPVLDESRAEPVYT